MLFWIIIRLLIPVLIVYFYYQTCVAYQNSRKKSKSVPISVNYHFTRKCNYTCTFCFHTATTSHKAEADDAMQALKLLAEAGMKKINFAGGEPFLYARHLGRLVDYCKEELKLEAVSIVSNGSKITESWIRDHAQNLDILAISCDSFDEGTNIKIGRGTGTHIAQLHLIATWCREYGVLFKLNSVICSLNWREDMNLQIERLNPVRWKVFQVLLVQGENDSNTTKRDARNVLISDDEFDDFCNRHSHQPSFVPESNRLMKSSYLILDEYLRFLDRTGKQPSKSILEVGVQGALESVFWDQDGFHERGGVYAWNEEKVNDQTAKEDRKNQTAKTGCCGQAAGALESDLQQSGRDMEDFGVELTGRTMI